MSCVHNYDTTTETYEVEDITTVFGCKDARWFRVKWTGYDDEEWEREHLLRRDGCEETTRHFWTTTGMNPNLKFYPDPDGQ